MNRKVISNDRNSKTVDDIPYDCVKIILDYLNEIDLTRIIGVSKRWSFSIFAKNEKYWKKPFERDFPVTLLNKSSMDSVELQKTFYEKFRVLKYQEMIRRRKMASNRPYNVPISENVTKKCHNIKLVCSGDGAVGKTCLLITYTTGKFPRDYIPTVFDNFTKPMATEDQKSVNLTLWDLAGEEDYHRLRPLSYPGTNVFLFCFSLVNRRSFQNILDVWDPEITRHAPGVPKILIGTKKDLRDDPEVLDGPMSKNRGTKEAEKKAITYEEGLGLARKIQACAYFEVSSLKGEGVNECFEELVRIVMKDDRKRKNRWNICGIM